MGRGVGRVKISTQRAFDGHTLTHEIRDDFVCTVLTDREGWYVTSLGTFLLDDVSVADAICQNNDEIYKRMGWDE